MRRFYPPTTSDLSLHGGVDVRMYGDVHRERIRAHEKFDALGDSRERAQWDEPTWLPILVEEVGEVAHVLSEIKLGNEPHPRPRMREELVQVAAMACAWIDAIDLEESP